ncbi:hypothetical protein [Vibrio parahaemolyticus]|uniref:hypothetical protein n=1 Tax=Vibrio parahaemolyticus TaxID=670 RepID=UPI0011247EAB|nr:hypothetical protein [Vibrio parahaemolyticus]TOI38986.1 hypothetical protein CGI60_23485 [Vibrio parahaemolyticus]
MEKKVFYSWQSDLPNKSNRGFIGDALERAIKQLVTDDSFKMTPSIDRDTLDELGSPDIVHTIFGKIESCDVFVCDISFINSNQNAVSRLVPNPNVILELGYAVGVHDWTKVILVMNTYFGGAEHLPFDLRGRRVLTYHLDPEAETKAEERKRVASVLTESIRGILNHFASKPNDKHQVEWKEQASEDVQASANSDEMLKAKLNVIKNMPYVGTKNEALSKACVALIEKSDLENAYLFAVELPYVGTKNTLLSKIVEKALDIKNFKVAQQVVQDIPYTGTKSSLSSKIADAIEL